MNYSKLSDQATDTASNVATSVSDTVTGAVSTGLERGRDLVSTAVDRLPEASTAGDWTRDHVPGLASKRRRPARSWLPLLGAIAAVALVVWLLRRDSEPDSNTPR